MTSSTSAEPIDRRTRDARIRELAGLGWSNARIGGDLGISDERVRQILKTPDPVAQLAEQETRLQAEIDDLVRHREANRRRIRVVQRTLERIAEEREAKAIDRLLGLS